MTFKKCRNLGCEIMIEVRKVDEGWRPFEESGNMHQCQFSDYAKRQKTTFGEKLEMDKDNHGNEDTGPPLSQVQESPKFVDHTAAGTPQIITIVGQTAEEMDDLANSWLKKTHGKIRFKGGQRVTGAGEFEITFYYEELK